MIVNKAAISAAFISLRALYNKAFSETESFWQKVAMRIPANTKQEDYAWLSNFPKMRKWMLGRSFQRGTIEQNYG